MSSAPAHLLERLRELISVLAAKWPGPQHPVLGKDIRCAGKQGTLCLCTCQGHSSAPGMENEGEYAL